MATVASMSGLTTIQRQREMPERGSNGLDPAKITCPVALWPADRLSEVLSPASKLWT